ncbi:MAG: hypothetical protein Kow0058_14560 [Roseovarius sp.]
MQIDDIRYNPELCGFEALVRFHEDDVVITYPVFLPAPVNAEFALVMRGLARKAREMHRAPQKGLVMRRPVAPIASGLPLAARRLLQGLLRRHHAA